VRTALLVTAVLGAVPAVVWIAVLAHPARPWDLRPRDEDVPGPPAPEAWPPVAVLVPARNEAAGLAETLPALLAQDYPGPWRAVLVDDRSGDGTAAAARGLAGDAAVLEVVDGAPLPPGWVGKVWALDQAARRALDGEPPRWLLLTDADIRHAPDSLRRLVAEAETDGLALLSRMARLRCTSPGERLLVPPFLLFFNLMYPMRWVNRPGRTAAAAGGCVLLRRDALEAMGGLAAIRGEVIDDLALARRVKRGLGRPIRLAVSERRVLSVRAYPRLGSVWRMVRRSAFTQLRRSWALLAVTLAGLAMLFALPPLALGLGLGAALAGAALPWSAVAAAEGALAWAAMAAVAGPAARYFDLGAGWRWTLPISGVLYGAMTVDSALRGPARGWR
jgi:hopene-associated glycosyltransferase HpnB